MQLTNEQELKLLAHARAKIQLIDILLNDSDIYLEIFDDNRPEES